MSIFQGATNIEIRGGVFVTSAAGSSVTFNQGSLAGSSSAFKDLSAAAAHTALHDSAARFDAPRCHRNTRAKYRDRLELWMLGKEQELEGKQLIWLLGGAGAGKSAIMQSVAEQCAQHGSVLASFFFSRTDPSRNYAEVLIPTFAYQVARTFPEAMVVLDPLIQRNPLIFKATLHSQALELLIRPLLYLIENGFLECATPLRRVFIIDGLDECGDPQKRALIIQIVASILCDYNLPISFVIASRPEMTINLAFAREKKLQGTFSRITLENDADAESDIRQFVQDSFLDILDRHPWNIHIQLPWPDPDSITNLVWKSSGHFIYAATALRFIASSDEHPGRALKVVEGLEPSRTGTPFAELDALYMHILTSARYSNQVLKMLRHCYLSLFNSFSVVSVCYVHHIAPQDVSLFLSDVQSLVSVASGNLGDCYVVPKHASLGDFFRNEARSQELYIDRRDYHASLLPRYFQFLDNGPYVPTPLLCANFHYHVWWSLLYDLSWALKNSKDTKLLRSLVSCHSPYNVWNFCIDSVALEKTLSSHNIRYMATKSISGYICSLRDSAALQDDALYSHQLEMYIELVLDDINDLVRKKPQYCIIPALMFSSCRSGLLVACDLMFWDDQFHIGELDPSHIFYPLKTQDMSRKIDPRAIKTVRQMPQSQISWSPDLAILMKHVLRQLVHLSGPPPSILHTSPHRQWLRRHKALRQISFGSPRMSSARSHHITLVQTGKNGADTYKNSSFLYSCWRRLLPLYRDKIGKQRRKCRALLKAVILYLHKSDCTSEVVMLARHSLPMLALWFPELMTRARVEMDAYVRRWEESLEGLLEKSKSLAIDDID